MRGTTLVALGAAFLLAAPAFAQDALKTAVDGTFAPHAMPKLSGGIEGFNVDLTDAIAHQLDKKITVDAAQFSGLIPALQAGTYDFLIAPVTVTKERADSMLFTEGYLNTDFQFITKRDAPDIAAQCWTHGFPAGPKGRFAPFLPFFWSIWNFSRNKEAAKSLLVHLSQPESIARLVEASGGYDLPAFEKLTLLKTWAEQGPPKGTLFHYPNPYNHQILSIAASPAPPKIAQQIYAQAVQTKMCLKYYQGGKMEDVLAWAEGECEGYMRS